MGQSRLRVGAGAKAGAGAGAGSGPAKAQCPAWERGGGCSQDFGPRLLPSPPAPSRSGCLLSRHGGEPITAGAWRGAGPRLAVYHLSPGVGTHPAYPFPGESPAPPWGGGQAGWVCHEDSHFPGNSGCRALPLSTYPPLGGWDGPIFQARTLRLRRAHSWKGMGWEDAQERPWSQRLGQQSTGLGAGKGWGSPGSGHGAHLVQMTSSCRLPWQRWHCVQRREKRSSRAFRWDTWGWQRLSRAPRPPHLAPPHLPALSPPSDTAQTPGAGRTHTRLLGKAGQHRVLGPSQELGHPIPAHCQSQLLKVPRGWRTTERVCWENSPGELPGWGPRTLCGGWREGPPAQGPWVYWVAVPAPGVGV